MKSFLQFVLAFAATAAIFSPVSVRAGNKEKKQPKEKLLIEDCKYVTLNNAIRLAYANNAVVRVSINPKSNEGPKSEDHKKSQLVVLNLFTRGSAAPTEFSVQFNLLDPDDGFCALDNGASSIKVLSPSEVAAIPLLPQGGDPIPGDTGRYWSPCTAMVVNEALNVWSQQTKTPPLVQLNSTRIEAEKKERTFNILLSDENTALIKTNPAHPAPGLLGKNGLTVTKITTDGTAGTCTFK